VTDRRERLPAVICVDVEPDPRAVDRTRRERWHGFEALQSTFAEWRAAMRAQAGAPARLAWFLRLDPQIADVYGSPAWALGAYGAFVNDARREGDEIGIHPHAYRWVEALGSWINDYADQRWIEHCVRMSAAAFRDALGEPCHSSRFGDHWMNDATVRLLEEIGVRFDLTLEPGKPSMAGGVAGERWTDGVPDLTAVPSAPYRPSHADFRRPDPGRSGGLWMLPVTTRRLTPALRYARRAFCRLTGLPLSTDVVSLSLALRPALFRDVLASALASAEIRMLVFVLRTDSGVDARERPRLLANLRFLLTARAARSVVFVTPGEAARMLGLA
jgi:hypothetical protein